MGISSAEKILIILKAFSSIDQEIGNLELSQKLGFPTSTVNRLLRILVCVRREGIHLKTSDIY